MGLGGIGVSAVARLFLFRGASVSGSDVNESEIIKALKKEGVLFFLGHKKENLAKDVELLIYSPAVSKNNPERKEAEKLGIKQYSYPEFLGELSQEQFTIAISGTDGKSTTTAMAGLVFGDAGVDPTVIVGSKVKQFNENLRIGQSPYLILEACEYQANMLNLRPQIIVLTNITADHLDYYGNLNNILTAFKKYVSFLPKDGELVINADDKNCMAISKSAICPVATYGINENAELMAKNIIIKNRKQIFEVIFNNKSLGKFSLAVPGKFNIYNALAVIRLALAFDIEIEIIKKTLSIYHGIWRRFEILGKSKNGSLVISDYAHTPQAVAGTIKATKEFYPDRKIIVVFQPHHRSRTKLLFNEFVKSFDFADAVILPEIYDVAGREKGKDKDISSNDLVSALRKRKKSIEIYFMTSLQEAEKLVLKKSNNESILLMMGAGDIYRVALNVIK